MNEHVSKTLSLATLAAWVLFALWMLFDAPKCPTTHPKGPIVIQVIAAVAMISNWLLALWILLPEPPERKPE